MTKAVSGSLKGKSLAGIPHGKTGRLTVHYDSKHRSAAVFDQQGKQLVSVRTFWFAWYAFHPETQIYVAQQSKQIKQCYVTLL